MTVLSNIYALDIVDRGPITQLAPITDEVIVVSSEQLEEGPMRDLGPILHVLSKPIHQKNREQKMGISEKLRGRRELGTMKMK